MSENEGAKRLFFGVRISLGAVQDLAALVESMQPLARAEKLDVRWLAPATYHITLKFLGWAKSEVVPAVRESFDGAFADVEPFGVTMRGVGAFASEKKARVLWAGIDRGTDELKELAERIDARAAELGFEREKRAFHPHVTFARLKNPANASALILPFSEDTFRKTKVDRVVLFESVTKPKGAEYSALAEWRLGG